jgi:hypothetical protein
MMATLEAPLVAAYRELHALSARQLDALAGEDLDTFWLISQERDGAFAHLRGLEASVPELSDEDKTTIQALIPAILRQDQRLEIRLNELSERTRGEISQVHTGITALHAYASQSIREAYFIDRNS